MQQRIVLSPIHGNTIPFYLESIGFNSNQEKLIRTQGYPFYHWLQTMKGTGEIYIEGRKYIVEPQSGILISPQTPHSYESVSVNSWETAYLTFGGSMVKEVLDYIQVQSDTLYLWDKESMLNHFIANIIKNPDDFDDTFGLSYSASVYQFLLIIQNYARLERKMEISENLFILAPLIQWLDENLTNPDIGISECAEYLCISPRKLNYLFQETYKVSPYAFLLNLRIKKAKELLHQAKDLQIKELATMVGFRSVSHFVATFRKNVGLTPEKYKRFN